MPVPKRRHSSARRDKRSAGRRKLVGMGNVSNCQTCDAPVVPHSACNVCGYYKGTKVLVTKMDRMKKRAQAREKSSINQQKRLAEKTAQQNS